MVNILDPREGESIYDPACGTGGMLLEAIHHVRERHEDDRTLWGKAYEQFKDEAGFTRVATQEEIRAKDGNLSIPLYVAPPTLGTNEERADYAANAAA
jgi:type I restriction-modification system DNA methylase subunit